MIRELRDLFLGGPWWQYQPNDPSWFSAPYHVFNLFEGLVWVVFAILVLIRCARKSRSWVEAAYAFAFFTFGLTDFREAHAMISWLLGVKLINLIVLYQLRAVVIRRFYPESRLY